MPHPDQKRLQAGPSSSAPPVQTAQIQAHMQGTPIYPPHWAVFLSLSDPLPASVCRSPWVSDSAQTPHLASEPCVLS